MKTILVTGGDNYFNGRKENHIPGAEYRAGHTKNIETLVPETPDVVYHLGEYARIAPSFDDVQLVHDMNTAGTFAVVEFCRKRKVGKLVYSASSTKFAVEGDGRHQNPYAFVTSMTRLAPGRTARPALKPPAANVL